MNDTDHQTHRVFVCQDCGTAHTVLYGRSIICGCGTRSAAEIVANDDAAPAANAISFTDLVALSGIDEDTLLRRFAGILDARVEKADADAKPKEVAPP